MYLVMDVDGTLTDGKIYMSEEGELCKAFHIKDGCGIHDLALPNGMIPVIITGRTSSILVRRCEEIGIQKLYQGISDKGKFLETLIDDLSKTAYIGDDLNDLSCMRLVKNAGGLVGCPADAAKQVIELADYVCGKNGGDGAVREFIEWLLEKNI